MLRPKNAEKFHGYVVDLTTYLRRLFRSDKKIMNALNNVHRKHRQMDNDTYIEYTLNNLSPYIDYISQKDEFIFTPEFGKKSLNFLIGLDFRTIWNSLESENKRVVFRYLEFIYMQSSLALNKNKSKVAEIVECIKVEQELEKEAMENPNAFGDSGNGNPFDINSIFGDDNILLDIAQDIKAELNFEELLGGIMGGDGLKLKPGQNPMDLINNMAQNPEIMSVMNNFGTKLQQKLQDKNVSPEELQKSAEKLKENLGNSISNMPGGSQLKKMLKNFDIETLARNFSNAQAMQQQQQQQLNSSSENQSIDAQQMLQQMMQNGGNPQFQQMMEQMQQSMMMHSNNNNEEEDNANEPEVRTIDPPLDD